MERFEVIGIVSDTSCNATETKDLSSILRPLDHALFLRHDRFQHPSFPLLVLRICLHFFDLLHAFYSITFPSWAVYT